MTWAEDAKYTFEQAMKQFKGKRFRCCLCGMEGDYDRDLEPYITRIGECGILEGNIYKASVETGFRSKDYNACCHRRESKSKK